MNAESRIIELEARQKMVEAKIEALIDVLAKEGMVARIDFEEEVEKKVKSLN